MMFLAFWKKRDRKMVGEIQWFLNINVHDNQSQTWRVLP